MITDFTDSKIVNLIIDGVGAVMLVLGGIWATNDRRSATKIDADEKIYRRLSETVDRLTAEADKMRADLEAVRAELDTYKAKYPPPQ